MAFGDIWYFFTFLACAGQFVRFMTYTSSELKIIISFLYPKG
jgi:hypothetical protein